MKSFLACVLVLATALLVMDAQAQRRVRVPEAVLLPVDDGAYVYVERLQRRGLLRELNPTGAPYTLGELDRALRRINKRRLGPQERRWVRILETRLGRKRVRSGELQLGAELRAGSRLTTTRRLDMMRPLGDDEPIQPFASLRGYVAHGNWAAQIGVSHDRHYVVDPDGIEAVRRLQARNEENYIGYSGRWFSIYAGRFTRHWSQPGLAGLFISDNPRSYDALSFRIGNDRLALRSVVGELDAMAADETYTGRAFEPGSIRRYVSAHRVDWRPRENIVVSFIESGLFSGASSGFSLKYLNPVQVFIFAIDNQPKNDENKGLIGGNLWMQFGRTTLNGQLLIDDVDIMGETREPMSIALAGRAVQAGVLPWMDLGVDVELVTARTFNTHQTEGQYLYLLRGLATNFSDYVQAGIYADVYADALLPGLALKPGVTALWQGEFDMRLPFPDNIGDVGTILKGDEVRTVRASLPIRLQPSARFWIEVDPGVNFTSNVDHVRGRTSTRFVGLATFGLRIPVNGTVGSVF